VKGEGRHAARPSPLTLLPSPFYRKPLLGLLFLSEAGEGSRTLVSSLEGYGSTVELHPHVVQSVGGEGFEPSKALPSDLQSDPFDHSGNPPNIISYFVLVGKTSRK
jgi:hypothetical protein